MSNPTLGKVPDLTSTLVWCLFPNTSRIPIKDFPQNGSTLSCTNQVLKGQENHHHLRYAAAAAIFVLLSNSHQNVLSIAEDPRPLMNAQSPLKQSIDFLTNFALCQKNTLPVSNCVDFNFGHIDKGGLLSIKPF